MPRATWKGAISFGLVNIPVALYVASQEEEIDFDWLDKRTHDPVGYKRVNKRTGKEIDKDDIVKAVKQQSGDYVVLSDEEIARAFPKSTQTIDIEAFVPKGELPLPYLEKPYYVGPVGRGSDKAYALLREAMKEDEVIAIARFVLRTKEHLAALMPAGSMLVLETIRWHDEIIDAEQLGLPQPARAEIKPAELKMAHELIERMSQPWNPNDYAARFSQAIRALVARKAKAGETAQVEPLEDTPTTSNVIDLTALLKQSLSKGNRTPARKPALARSAAKNQTRKRA